MLTNAGIADLANFGWVNSAEWAGVDTSEFPELKAWAEKLKARPAVAKGLDVPIKNPLANTTDPKELERIAKQNSAWVMKGMEEDKKK